VLDTFEQEEVRLGKISAVVGEDAQTPFATEIPTLLSDVDRPTFGKKKESSLLLEVR
jgi:hypothetical protein